MATNFGKLNFSTAFNPTSAFPLDARSYFESLEAAQAAAATAEEAGSSKTVYHYGELLTVYDKEEGTVAAYVITPSKSLQKLAATTASGDLEADVTELQGKVTALESTVGDSSSGLVKDVADLETSVGTISSTVGTLSSGLSTVSGKVTTLEGTVSTLSTTVGGLTTSVAANTTSISALNGRLTTAESDIDALQAQIGGLTGAMHFIGTSTTDPAEGATVSGHEEFESGDVCLFEGKEYVYDGATWQELGDEGSHLTKTEAAATYVPLTRTINGHSLNANVTLSVGDVGADTAIESAVNAAKTEINGTISTLSGRVDQLETDKVTSADITAAINALDVATVSVGAGETIKTITQTDGKIAVEKQAITVSASAVTGLADAVGPTIDGKIEDLDLANTYLGLHAKADTAATADKVAHKVTIGSKEFDGSAEVTVTATDLGALTAIPQATAEALGGIKLGHTEGANEHAVVLDSDGKAYVTVSIPAAVTYSAGAGLTLSGTTFAIGTGAVTNDMLAGSIQDAKIASVNVQKLTQTEGDSLILDGGNATLE